MKKLLSILSMAAIAAPAFADQPVAGTAEAPNYYLIKANRGIPYLGYNAEGNGVTNLLRTDDMTFSNLWAVTPGSVEGSVVIKNAAADAYLMGFVKDGVSTTASDATAVTTSTPTDLFLVDMGGAYAINIISATGAEYPNNCYSLDAPSQGAACGNYIPTSPTSGQGTSWWFTKIEVAEGQTPEQGFFNYMTIPAINDLNTYKAAVPAVAAELEAGIAAINALTFDAGLDAINAAKAAAYEAANAKLATVYNGGTYIFENPRRGALDTCTEGQYLATSAADTKYVGTTDVANAAAKFVLTSKDGGYTAYNAETKTYIGTTALPVANEADAQVFYPILYANSGYVGVALCVTAEKNGNGFNWQSWNNGSFSFYSIGDGGSIWRLVNDDPAELVEKVVAPIITELMAYVPAVPMINEIITKAVSDLRALTFDDEISTKAEAIRSKAIDDANALISATLSTKTVAMKNLRADDYLCVANNSFNHAANYDEASAIFTFKPAADGGFKVYNASAGIYVGPKEEVEGSNALTMVTDEAAAIACYPALHHFGDFWGVAFFLTAEKNGNALNMNASAALHSYLANDGGSVWGVVETTGSALIEHFEQAETPAMTGIYDLQGRKLAAPVKGINIINGKKVYVK